MAGGQPEVPPKRDVRGAAGSSRAAPGAHAGDDRPAVVLRREDLPPDVARRFRTGADCLDLTHTGGEGRYAVFELLHRAEDLERWLSLLLATPVTAVGEDVGPVREVRNAIARAARAIAAGGEPAAEDVARINAVAAGCPVVDELTGTGLLRRLPATAAQASATLAREAVALLGGPLAGSRIRTCAAPDCGLLFVDRSRPGQRRWCSMERCGNRSKTRRYRTATQPGA